jgi:hypothetical protein
MNKVRLDLLTERHLLLFGTIMQWFAQYELLMQEVMAVIAGCDPAVIMLLTRGLDFSGKRRALLDLLRHRTVPVDRYDRISSYLVVPHTLTPLRNDIAHSVWRPGTSASGIQPDWLLRLPRGIKPLHGNDLPDENNVEYSLEDLNETVETLAENYERLSDYLREIGLLGSNVKE